MVMMEMTLFVPRLDPTYPAEMGTTLYILTDRAAILMVTVAMIILYFSAMVQILMAAREQISVISQDLLPLQQTVCPANVSSTVFRTGMKPMLTAAGPAHPAPSPNLL